MFNQGRALLSEGKLDDACPKLAESLRLDTGIGTMLYLAECYERSGKIASAWAQFREAQASASKDGDQRERIARDRADQLEPKLSRLTIVVPKESDVEGLVVTRDGSTIGRAAWGVEAPVDPGSHVLRASAPGREPHEVKIEVAGGAAQARFVVPALAAAQQAAPPSNQDTLRPAVGASTLGNTQRTIALVVGGVGVVALGVGAFMGFRAIGSLDDSKAHCGDKTCDREGLDLRDTSQSQANVATILFVASGLALASGAVLWLTAPRASSSASAHPRGLAVVPAAMPGGAALGAAFRF